MRYCYPQACVWPLSYARVTKHGAVPRNSTSHTVHWVLPHIAQGHHMLLLRHRKSMKKNHTIPFVRAHPCMCVGAGGGKGGQAASSAKTGYITAMQYTVLQSAISRTELQSAQPAAGDDSTAALAPSHTNDLDTAHATAQHTNNGKARQRLVLLQRGAHRGAALITNGIPCRPHVQRNTNRQITTSSSFFGPLHNTTTAPTCVTQYQHLHHNNRRVLPATARCL